MFFESLKYYVSDFLVHVIYIILNLFKPIHYFYFTVSFSITYSDSNASYTCYPLGSPSTL